MKTQCLANKTTKERNSMTHGRLIIRGREVEMCIIFNLVYAGRYEDARGEFGPESYDIDDVEMEDIYFIDDNQRLTPNDLALDEKKALEESTQKAIANYIDHL